MSGTAMLANAQTTHGEAHAQPWSATTSPLQEDAPKQAARELLRRVATGDAKYKIRGFPKENKDIYDDPSAFSHQDEIDNCVINLPNLFKAKQVLDRSVNTLQEWEGLVSSVDGDIFIARLHDVSGNRQGEDWAEIPLTDVDPHERDRVIPGALFHIIVGYTTHKSSRRKEMLIYFRRHLPRAENKFKRVSRLLKVLSGTD